jgi:hypothetical protein
MVEILFGLFIEINNCSNVKNMRITVISTLTENSKIVAILTISK